MGDICLYQSMLLDPAWMHDYNRVYTDFWKAHYGILFEEAGLPDGIHVYEDLGYRNGLFCSPKVLADVIFPYYAEIVEFFHSYGLPVLLHSCGMVEEALPLIVEAGFDCLDPMEVKAGNRPLDYAERYGERLAFMGGLDARVLESGDRALIRREVAALIDGMKSRGARYIFHSDHSLSTNVDYDDYRCALDAYRERMMLLRRPGGGPAHGIRAEQGDMLRTEVLPAGGVDRLPVEAEWRRPLARARNTLHTGHGELPHASLLRGRDWEEPLFRLPRRAEKPQEVRQEQLPLHGHSESTREPRQRMLRSTSPPPAKPAARQEECARVLGLPALIRTDEGYRRTRGGRTG